MEINKSNVNFYLEKSEDARLNFDELKSLYGSAVEPFDIKETDTQGYIYRRHDAVIIAFRGSQQVPDWFTDFDGFQVVYPYDNPSSDIKVHKGFIGAYKSVRETIHEAIKRINPKTIITCGHSLGGALATLCAVDMQYNFSDKVLFCYTSGSPKVGNKSFMESFNKRIPNMVRTYMYRDIVPKCPPSWLEKLSGGKYFHVGTPNPIGPKLFMYGIFSWLFKQNNDALAGNLTNHSIDLYRKFS